MAALTDRRIDAAPLMDAPPIAILVPAHDEAAGIGAVLAATQEQMRPCDRLIVVADNCTDDTAIIATRAGAEVIERHDPKRRGKAYALDFGRDFLTIHTPPAIVIVMDADTLPEAGAIQHIASQAWHEQAVLQGCYLLQAPGNDPVVSISTFAFWLKNLVRQKGLYRLSGLALLQGSGMAFPWEIFRRAPLASASLVEDLELGADLVLSGTKVGFCERARFTSGAAEPAGTRSQRTRWEHGYLSAAPRLSAKLMRAALGGRAGAIALSLDLMVPPLGALAIVAALALAAIGAGAVAGASMAPLLFLLICLGTFALSLGLVWLKWGRTLLPPAALLGLPGYFLWKLPILMRFFTRRERHWVRTERETPP
ncbi:glycosyltransferase family 2 protein [Sphingomonas sp. C3-2]|uniref:glycosyltransferase family 2 protein n=1 Tax=Sphingomonas sp. C3-2 TaxID=3062169 RepID=UPI00294B75B4|nr:glycosyltransferase family 2 protein [Sphingomonas sp. C3-2]WOK36579.1 glycosyltransferase family 2 protein [Sphingomonas sp. C3-2]